MNQPRLVIDREGDVWKWDGSVLSGGVTLAHFRSVADPSHRLAVEERQIAAFGLRVLIVEPPKPAPEVGGIVGVHAALDRARLWVEYTGQLSPLQAKDVAEKCSDIALHATAKVFRT